MKLYSFLCTLFLIFDFSQPLIASGAPYHSYCLLSPEGVPCFTAPHPDGESVTMIPLDSIPQNHPYSWRNIFNNPATATGIFAIHPTPQEATGPGYQCIFSYAVGTPPDPRTHIAMFITNPLFPVTTAYYVQPASQFQQNLTSTQEDESVQASDNAQQEAAPVQSTKTLKKKFKTVNRALARLEEQPTAQTEAEQAKIKELREKQAALLSLLKSRHVDTTDQDEPATEPSGLQNGPAQSETVPAAAPQAASVDQPAATQAKSSFKEALMKTATAAASQTVALPSKEDCKSAATQHAQVSTSRTKKNNQFIKVKHGARADTIPADKIKKALHLVTDTATPKSAQSGDTNKTSKADTQPRTSTDTAQTENAANVSQEPTALANQKNEYPSITQSKQESTSPEQSEPRTIRKMRLTTEELIALHTKQLTILAQQLSDVQDVRIEHLKPETAAARAICMQELHTFIAQDNLNEILRAQALVVLASTCQTKEEFQACSQTAFHKNLFSKDLHEELGLLLAGHEKKELVRKHTAQIADLEESLITFQETKFEVLGPKTAAKRTKWRQDLHTLITSPGTDTELKTRAIGALITTCKTPQEFKECFKLVLQRDIFKRPLQTRLVVLFLRHELDYCANQDTEWNTFEKHLSKAENLFGQQALEAYPNYYNVKSFFIHHKGNRDKALEILSKGLEQHKNNTELLGLQTAIVRYQTQQEGLVQALVQHHDKQQGILNKK